MADYYVECVCFDDKGRIEALKLLDTATQGSDVYLRSRIIEMIDVYDKVILVPDPARNYERPLPGAQVVTYTTANGTFIRTDANRTERDNLDNARPCADVECVGVALLRMAGQLR